MRYNDDTQLWTEILNKELVANQMHKAYNETDFFADTHASRFGGGKLNRTTRHGSLLKDVTMNKLSAT